MTLAPSLRALVDFRSFHRTRRNRANVVMQSSEDCSLRDKRKEQPQSKDPFHRKATRGWKGNSQVHRLVVDAAKILGVSALSHNSVDDFQRELNLPRRPRGFADDPEPAPVHNVRRQPKIHDIKDVEELCAKLERSHFRIATMAERCVFNERKIEVVKCGPTECVAPKSAETPAMRPGSSRNLDG